jgi:D-amino-acid dehydrogenase
LPIVGGIYTPADESGDARQFTDALAQQAAAAGVRFRYGESVAALLSEGGRCLGARLASGEAVRGDATVLALGSYSPGLLRPFGVRLPVYPAKGYSATFALPHDLPAHAAPIVSLTDDHAKLVFSRLGQRLRVAGTAEFTGYDLALTPARCAALVRRTHTFFPALATTSAPEFWCGLRPATPSNVPLIGELSGELHAAGLAGLWLNTGHGTLGWTLACGSAIMLRDLLAGRAPAVDPAPYRHI